MHDPKVFNNPMEYQPERYLKDGKLNPDVMDPHSAAFGFGRRSVDSIYSATYIGGLSLPRICSGRHLSDNSLYCIASSLLAVYDIKPPVDDQGTVIQLKPEFTNGILS